MNRIYTIFIFLCIFVQSKGLWSWELYYVIPREYQQVTTDRRCTTFLYVQELRKPQSTIGLLTFRCLYFLTMKLFKPPSCASASTRSSYQQNHLFIFTSKVSSVLYNFELHSSIMVTMDTASAKPLF